MSMVCILFGACLHRECFVFFHQLESVNCSFLFKQYGSEMPSSRACVGTLIYWRAYGATGPQTKTSCV
ncbi:hypothetical protein RIF29_00728 [Crotalaria pallida]|uniref:Uncharacterized protein n=1 Tax=Crotalaria pallida TaxID=3830 RepID=A0AAN9P6R2_CROPI